MSVHPRLAPIVMLAVLLAPRAVPAQLAAEFQGDWVPATASCDSAQRLRVGADTLTLINGKDVASYGNLGIPMPASFFGPDYNGISVVAMAEVDSGDAPFTVYFNDEEKKGVTRVEIYQEIKGALNAQVQAIQAAHEKLASRFPDLNLKPLKHCAAK